MDNQYEQAGVKLGHALLKLELGFTSIKIFCIRWVGGVGGNWNELGNNLKIYIFNIFLKLAETNSIKEFLYEYLYLTFIWTFAWTFRWILIWTLIWTFNWTRWILLWIFIWTLSYQLYEHLYELDEHSYRVSHNTVYTFVLLISPPPNHLKLPSWTFFNSHFCVDFKLIKFVIIW